MGQIRERLRKYLFPADSADWLPILRIGLGVQVTCYALAWREYWPLLFVAHGNVLLTRELMEAILSAETRYAPRLGWLVAVGAHLGLNELTILSLTWGCLVIAGVCLIVGVFCRPAAAVAWFLYVCSVTSGQLFSYGVDNFTTIGLFYLMIAPLRDSYWWPWKLRPGSPVDPHRLGFHRRVLQLHLCLIYFFGGITKCLGSEWWNGISVWRALTRPPFNFISPELLIHFAPLLPLLGALVCVLETGYPIFIWPGRTRAIWLAGILAMHLAIGLAMGLYLFALIMIVLNLAAFGAEFVPGMQKLLVFRAEKRDTEPAAAGSKTATEEPA